MVASIPFGIRAGYGAATRYSATLDGPRRDIELLGATSNCIRAGGSATPRDLDAASLKKSGDHSTYDDCSPDEHQPTDSDGDTNTWSFDGIGAGS